MSLSPYYPPSPWQAIPPTHSTTPSKSTLTIHIYYSSPMNNYRPSQLEDPPSKSHTIFSPSRASLKEAPTAHLSTLPTFLHSNLIILLHTEGDLLPQQLLSPLLNINSPKPQDLSSPRIIQKNSYLSPRGPS